MSLQLAPSVTTLQRLLVGLSLAGLAGLAVAAAWNSRRTTPAPAVERPGAAVAIRDRCAECHSDVVESFRIAPHARTLHSTRDPDILAKFAGRSFTRPATGVEYRYTGKDGQLWLSTPAYARDLPIDWVFGSG